jgi:Xaa-Pro aminopeptidase
MDQREPARGTAPWSRNRLDALRAALKADDLAGFILPLADEHLGEFMPDSSRRLSWLTGFTGSSGTAIVLADKAALFVDGRYALQAGSEVDSKAFEVRHFRKPPPLEWLAQQIASGGRIGYDPRITSARAADQLNNALKEVGAGAIALDVNPVDPLWTDRPLPPRATVELYPLEFAGVSADDKIAAIASELGAKRVAATVLDEPSCSSIRQNLRRNSPLVSAIALRCARSANWPRRWLRWALVGRRLRSIPTAPMPGSEIAWWRAEPGSRTWPIRPPCRAHARTASRLPACGRRTSAMVWR